MCFGNPQVSTERDQVERDLDAMVIGVDVFVAHPGDEHRSIRVGDHAVDDMIDALLDLWNIGESAGADGGGDVPRDFFTVGKDLSGPRQLGLSRGGVVVGRQRHTLRQDAGQIQVAPHLRGGLAVGCGLAAEQRGGQPVRDPVKKSASVLLLVDGNGPHKLEKTLPGLGADRRVLACLSAALSAGAMGLDRRRADQDGRARLVLIVAARWCEAGLHWCCRRRGAQLGSVSDDPFVFVGGLRGFLLVGLTQTRRSPLGGHRFIGELEVDVDIPAVFAQGLEIGIVVEQETLHQQWRIDPGPIELGHEQSQFEIGDRYPQPATGRRQVDRTVEFPLGSCFYNHSGGHS